MKNNNSLISRLDAFKSVSSPKVIPESRKRSLTTRIQTPRDFNTRKLSGNNPERHLQTNSTPRISLKNQLINFGTCRDNNSEFYS